MVSEKIKEKRNNNINKLGYAKINVEYIQIQLRENLKYINDILPFLKKLKKIEYCFNYIKKNWYYYEKCENEIEKVKSRIKDYSNLYEEAILKRKILKLKLKQAQREFSKRQKSNIKFEKKHFNEEV